LKTYIGIAEKFFQDADAIFLTTGRLASDAAEDAAAGQLNPAYYNEKMAELADMFPHLESVTRDIRSVFWSEVERRLVCQVRSVKADEQIKNLIEEVI
jgi:hypothetical protein